MAKRVRTFIENPNNHIIKNVAIKDTGISINGRIAIDQFLKNRYMTKITKIIDINKVSATSVTAFLTNTVSSITMFNLNPSGKSFFSFSYSR